METLVSKGPQAHDNDLKAVHPVDHSCSKIGNVICLKHRSIKRALIDINQNVRGIRVRSVASLKLVWRYYGVVDIYGYKTKLVSQFQQLHLSLRN